MMQNAAVQPLLPHPPPTPTAVNGLPCAAGPPPGCSHSTVFLRRAVRFRRCVPPRSSTGLYVSAAASTAFRWVRSSTAAFHRVCSRSSSAGSVRVPPSPPVQELPKAK
ncbi:hypothetical protein RIF29_26668 [Crotalaria pallida]|uniref:Uncharacterized protein n=1 Tax=Crotalaria pallida TaxID=3830 RepID=A0AAN9ENX3_CROPI